MSESPSDEELMLAYVSGEAKALAQLFKRLAPRLLRSVQRQVGSEEDAREIVQQTFLNVHRARNDFRPGSKVRPWLYTIAFNLARDRFRRSKRRPEVLVEPERAEQQAVVEPMADKLVDSRAVQKALNQLPDAQREVIVLHWYEGLDFSEVANAVGASRSAVKVRAHRGYKRLRELLADFQVTTRGVPT